MDSDDNLATYGSCNTEHGHGYTVEVTLHGPTNPVYGMIAKRSSLNGHLQFVFSLLDHKDIDTDISYFHDRPSTPENIVKFIWKSLYDNMGEPNLLNKVKLYHTEEQFVVYRG